MKPQTATNEDSVTISLHELRRIEMDRQAHEQKLAEQQRQAAERARLEAQRAALERTESEKRRRLEAEQLRAERRAQQRARLEAEQAIAMEAARAAVDAKRVELEIKRVELEAAHVRSVAKPSAWRKLALIAMFAIIIGQALFIGATQRPHRAVAVTPAEVHIAQLAGHARPKVPADTGDFSSRPSTRPNATTHTHVHTTTTTTTTTTPERFTLDGCDPNQPLCQ